MTDAVQPIWGYTKDHSMVGKRVRPADPRKLVGEVVEVFLAPPPHLSMAIVVWDDDKERTRRIFPFRDLREIA